MGTRRGLVGRCFGGGFWVGRGKIGWDCLGVLGRGVLRMVAGVLEGSKGWLIWVEGSGYVGVARSGRGVVVAMVEMGDRKVQRRWRGVGCLCVAGSGLRTDGV